MKKYWPHIVVLTVLVLVIAAAASQVPKLLKPPERHAPIPVQTNPRWVMTVNVVTDQRATAYTESTGARPASSGQPYTLGSVAVHPETPGGDPTKPIIPYGTTIRLINPKHITIQGQKFNHLKVIDTGDVYWSLRNESPYWIDLYFGTTGSWSYREASRFGVKKVDYYWFHVIDENGPVTGVK
ncbi:MAG: hypothetical protein GXX09_09790 [Syntrophomonadaceae bacterium]|nr:hypothetical protein [Syntrophomonadaceae bacterium]